MSDLDAEIERAAGDADRERLRARLGALTDEIGDVRKTLRDVEADNERLRAVAEYSGRGLRVPKWTARPSRKSEHKGIVVAMLSDTHFDEVVNPAELSGYNAYDRTIAEQRLEQFSTGAVKVARDLWAGVKYDGAVLILGGDLISGEIHPELHQTNEGTTLETVLHWSGRVAAVVGAFAEEFGRVHVPCTVGNHGRRTLKQRAKRAVRDNYDWLICSMVARHFEKDDRVTFQIPDDLDCPFSAYETRFLLNHGETGGGGGIGGIWPPIMRLRSRKATRWAFDVMTIGHWHQYVHAPEQGMIVNGALKGYDEFAVRMAFPPERPSQAMWLVTPEKGITMAAPVFVADRKAEGW